MKSLTLSILPLSREYISGWEVSECDTWPHKRPRLAEECFHACDARGLVSKTSISDRFLSTLPFLFLCGRRSPRGLSDICAPSPSPPSFLCRFCQKEKKKTAKVKSPQSTSNRRSSSFLPASFSSNSGCPLAPVA